MLNTIIGIKKDSSQVFLADRSSIPVTILQVGPCVITQIKTKEKDGYQAVQLGFGKRRKKHLSKPVAGHLRELIEKNNTAPRYLKETRYQGELHLQKGAVINADQVIKPGDLVNVSGTSKGKGFTGVMKRWGFSGGSRTHGQSDRQRAPGSIGQATTPGRVFKGKKMAGRSGNAAVTIRNLLIVKVENTGEVWIKGQVPGSRNSLVVINKVGEDKKFKIIVSEKKETVKDEVKKQKEIKKEESKQKKDKK